MTEPQNVAQDTHAVRWNIRRQSVRSVTKDKITSCSGVNAVVPCPTDDDIISNSAVNSVVTRPTENEIVARPSDEQIVACATFNVVVTTPHAPDTNDIVFKIYAVTRNNHGG